MSLHPFRIVVLISGFGSNLQAIIDQIHRKFIPGTLVAVFSDQGKAYGLQRAAHADVPAIFINPKDYRTPAAFDAALLKQIDHYHPDLVVLSGFMRILSTDFVEHYAGRLINIHPSLLPKYPGLATHAKVLAAGDERHGSTVHFVTDELDSGPLIATITLNVNEEDTIDSLKARIQAKEHILYPTVIKWFAERRLRLEGKTVYLDQLALPNAGVELQLE
ncbi:MAG TPA: phosphoribosylglycinamide formyltransferase [Gammaproteobacteria bacterium]|nr:phosphoribosylglycinamide formyltransferase [Gammaproteobacteria bacterium]